MKKQVLSKIAAEIKRKTLLTCSGVKRQTSHSYKTKSLPLKMDGWKMKLPFGAKALFSVAFAVDFREGMGKKKLKT